MKPRFLFALLLFGVLAFAPAPLPRRDRGRLDEIDAARLQGDWRVTRWQVLDERGRAINRDWNIVLTRISVRGDRWTFRFNDTTSLTFPFAIDNGHRPAHLNFYELEDLERLSRMGSIRRHDGKVQIVYRILESDAERDRPSVFEPQPNGTFALTLERDG